MELCHQTSSTPTSSKDAGGLIPLFIYAALVGGKSRFACVDGPEFDAWEVNFDILMQRNRMYRDAEKRSLDEYRERLHAKESSEPFECLAGEIRP
jgi:hypothetical protein